MEIKTGRARSVRNVLWAILILNLFVALAKIAAGRLISSVSLTADGFHSLSDGTSNIVGLIGIALAARPIDGDHPYGHGKMETLASLFIAGMLLFLSVKVVYDAFTRLLSPKPPEVTWLSLGVLIATLGINVFVSVYEYRKGKALQSAILITDSAHTKSDIFISLGVLVSLLLIRLGLPPIVDPLVSLVVAGFILKACYEIFCFTRDILVDKALLDEEHIRKIVSSFEDVKNIHKIRSRGTAVDCHVDMHILVNPAMTVQSSHMLVHAIERRLIEEFGMNVSVIAHIEPYSAEELEQSE